MRASIAHAEGQVFVTMPVNEKVLGMTLARPGSMSIQHRQSGKIATLATGPVVAGDNRMVALRTLDRAELHMDKPLVASVGRELSAIYLP